MTNNSATSRRLPAEWEVQDAVLIAWPHELTDWSYMLDEVRACFSDIAHAIVRYSKLIVVTPSIDEVRKYLDDIAPDRIIYAAISTNDTWARDFGAITTVDADGHYIYNDFKFNGWGLKFAANLDNMISRRLYDKGIFSAVYRNRLGFVLEGGSIESDGRGTILTTSQCLMSPNRNGDLSRGEIESYIKDAFGASRVLWLEHGALIGDDTDSHIDTLARLLPYDTIAYVSCDDPDDPHYDDLKKMEAEIAALRTADERPYNMIALPLPDPVYDSDGMRLPATYANFLILNNAVLLPVYGQPRKDLLAQQMLKIVFHDYDIVPIDCRALIQQHGSLHCVTMQFPLNSIHR